MQQTLTRKVSRIAFSACGAVLPLGLLAFLAAPGWGQGPSRVVVVEALEHAISPPVDRLLPIPPTPAAFSAIPLLPGHGPRAPRPAVPDPLLGSSLSGKTLAATSPTNFRGLGSDLPNFTVQYIPPDTNGAVGPTEFVQWVNASFAAFDKATGNVVAGPAAGNTLWQALGGACARNNSGDPIAQYDKLAGRWVMMQPVFKSPYYLCVAVSSGSSFVASSWYLYSFQVPNKLFPDYPKLGVWRDGYYITYNQFQGQFFVGPAACALDGARMRAGQSATMQCFTNLGASYGSMLPADADGTAPPSGSPEYLINLGANNSSLDLWQFHVDWTTPSLSTLTSPGPTNIPVAAFSEACGGGACVPQANTSQLLDSLGDRVMYRLAYRNFGTSESLLVNHSVTAGTSGNNTGLRWYELQKSGSGSFGVNQQGTYAPDSNYRWMGSIAMDKFGNIALGYSVSSSGISPSIKYTGHVPGTDGLGQMGTEYDLLTGIPHGSQTSYNRWGDYSSMSVDPVDDCTFWFTTEYQRTNGNAWSTRIASIRFPACSGTSSSFSVSATPASQTVNQGLSTSYTVTVTPSGGFTGDVNLSAAGLPSGATASFSTTCGATLNCVTVSGSSASSTLTVATSSTTPAGSSTLTVTGTASSLTSSTNVTLVVNGPPAAPTGLTAIGGNQQVSLSWNASTGATSYNVKRGTASGSYDHIVTGVTSTSYLDTGLNNGTTYYYVVSAVNSAGEGANSGEVSATPAVVTAPDPPTGLTASQGPGAKKISLSWNASAGAATYNVKRSAVSGGPYTTIATGITATSYADTGLPRGDTYYYVVAAVNSAGAESTPSNQASAVVP